MQYLNFSKFTIKVQIQSVAIFHFQIPIIFPILSLCRFDNLQCTEYTDLVIPGLEKVIILRYRIRKSRVILGRMAAVFDRNAVLKQWCFGRTVSFSVMVDGGFSNDHHGEDVIFEFMNIPTFLSVEVLRKWFESIISEFGVFKHEPMENVIHFIFGSYHFVDTLNRRDLPSFSVTASIYDSAINPETMFNPKIGGLSVSMKRVQSNMMGSQCNKNTVNIST